ncbi:DUF4221 family protein [Negadavirga shengliensis]|uniref:DUF4221 family protein n=1 Tax=Negadavirga shengliensis TaxID=1389218 RepID=A0ABV9T0H2_9BACT
MKYFILIGILLGVWACGSKGKNLSSDLVRLDFSLDTVMVNPGQEILFVNYGLYHSQLNTSKTHLYNFNHTDFAIEKINLDELAFEEKINFSKEGPDGVGNYFRRFLLINDDTLLMSSYEQDGFFGWDAKKIRKFDFKKVGKEGDMMPEGDFLTEVISVPGHSDVFYGLVSNWQEKSTALVKLDLKDNLFKKIEVPLFEKSKKYEIEFNDGQRGFGMGSEKFINYTGGKIIIGVDVSNELYVLDPATDAINLYTYENELTANEKASNPPAQVGDMKEMESLFRKIQSEIGFHRLVWDEENEVYYRLSQTLEFDDSAERPENQLLPSASGAKVYITVFDKDLNKVAESLVPALDKRPARHFVKDGKIWIFENIEDEMGFVRLSVEGI